LEYKNYSEKLDVRESIGLSVQNPGAMAPTFI